MKVFCTLFVLSSMLFGQILYEEHFTGGNMQLQWHPWFTDTLGIGDSMHVLNDPTTPGGDSWVGVISNEYMSVAGLTYAGDPNLEDYSVEAWIYTVVTAGSGPYNGIAIRCDVDSGFYYRLVSDFDDSGQLRLGMFTGGMFPVVIRDWTGGEIPGGVPATSSWHKLKVTMIADSIWAYFDDVMLPDCPFTESSISKGYFGVYTFNMMAVDSTKCDDIIVRAEPTGVMEYGEENLTNLTVQPNPFTQMTDIRFHMTDEKTHLRVFDASGRMVKDFGLLSGIGDQLSVSWDGRDANGTVLAPGVYFIRDTNCNFLEKVVKLH